MGLRDKIRKDHRRSSSSHRRASSGSAYAVSTHVAASPAPASSIYYNSEVVPSPMPLKEDPDEFKLGRFINIAVTGQKQVGKSSLINAIAGKHVANLQAQKMGDSNLYKHPVLEDIIFHEISRNEAIRKDFRLFTLVIILFETSVTEADLEVAKRATEKKVPVIFVCPKADLTLKRLMNFANLNEREGIRETRVSINSRPDIQWFQRKEIDRKFYVVSCSDLFERSPAPLFDENEFLRHVTAYLQPARGYAVPDVHASRRMGPQSEGSGLSRYHHESRGPLPASKDHLYHKSAEVFGLSRVARTPPSGGSSNKSPPIRSGGPRSQARNTPPFRSTPPSAYLSPPPNFTASVPRSSQPRSPSPQFTSDPAEPWLADVRVAFVEGTENVNRGTLMECLLGGTRGNKMTIAPNVAYKHPDYPSASFQLIKSETVPSTNVQRYFETTLANMTLIVIVFTKHITEIDIKLVIQAKRFGIKFIFAHSKSTDAQADKTFSPRAALRRLKASHSDARQTLLKAGLRNEEILIFEVDKKILRYPESYPRADEEDFKEFIAEACGGRRSQHRGSSASKRSNHARIPSEPSRARAASSSIFGSRRSDSVHAAQRSPPSRSSAFVIRDASTEVNPVPALKSSHMYPMGGGTTPKGSATVTWQTPQEVRVGVVGRRQVGKSTLINGTLQLDVAPVGDGRRHDAPTVHRHPAHYDLLFEECVGYEPRMTQHQLEGWLHQQNLKSMDYVLIVINDKLCDVDAHIARYCEKRNIVVAVVATKADLLVAKGIYDEKLTEVAAINKARYQILDSFKSRLADEYIGVLRIFIISGRALNSYQRGDAEDVTRFQFDELDYLRFGKVRVCY
eukprot:Protomagalhaensia_sp_Gyna_25__1190@NODE_158_length_4758_cov_17_038356_g123_i0_p1_GENE_NODE_158_length_4758_cov_17_038356_g123_i0NODE_158_length_4758_cov_17_038356_g123_i0_p1_ORF_typecomplete_len850_score125_62IIGP/PF05049_13/1_1e15IIGP/PF05049_13/3e08IIGP/PF05049_13/8_4e18MMR_HSR1/PF01926_23/0_00062MMR_HSR1/PF01926_23/4e05Dynamin_N/PF00350_23/0_015Dynamin_N/PF00350_23/9_5e05FeoB_N/PF02421_18/0_00071FeoB_N/PF02421_18/68FeoB_N/PF02421_18/4_2FeoB_N/PF02421_18/77RsgA_GTPase/PF03193_16/0_0051RsgA_GTP